ncbi:hypothetical protein MP228_000083 [Amoeboaphelidium protococcarum]|nr:hypothetical protein MP228_000083 [Amoeboaphelidium protococcarum]
MGIIYTLSMWASAGVASRVLALGLQKKPLSHDLHKSALWIGTWTAIGWSFYSYKTRKELAYVERLQYLVDRKGRRDEWDRLYFNLESPQDQ